MRKALIRSVIRIAIRTVLAVVLITVFHILLWHGPHLYYVLQARRGAKLCRSVKPGMGRSQVLQKLHAVQPDLESGSPMRLYFQWRDAGCQVDFDAAGTVSKAELQQFDPVSLAGGGLSK